MHRNESWPAALAGEAFAYLTTTGRRTGEPHRIEIWFAVEGERLYLMSGGRDRSDWVRNIQADPRIEIEVGSQMRTGVARILDPDTPGDRLARELLVAKYATPGDPLDDWKVRSLPVEVTFPDVT